MNDQNETAQLRFLEETATRLRQNGFTVEPIEDHHLPVCWEKGRLCRISGKGSVLYRQECVDVPGAQDALQSVLRADAIHVLLPVQHTAPSGNSAEVVILPSDGQVLILDALQLKAGVYQADFEFLEVPELRHVGLIVHFEIPLQKCERPERSVTLRSFKVMRFEYKKHHTRIECGA